MTKSYFRQSVSGKGLSSDTDRSIDLDVYRCYFKDCIPPVPEAPPNGRPDDVLYWGEAEAWADVSDGWGGNTGSGSLVPENGDNVMIMPGELCAFFSYSCSINLYQE